MSYRIANVRFSLSDEQTYPVNCFRADVKAGHKVVVEMADQNKRFKTAIVESVEFKNWNCQNSILCLHSEVIRAPDGTWSFELSHISNGQIHQVRDLEDRLLAAGWSRNYPARKYTYRVIYSYLSDGGTAEVRIRKNGIDFRAPGRSVNHWFYHSEIDLLELCWSFAERWRTESVCLEDHFKPRGTAFPRPTGSRDELADIYGAISDGTGGNAYLGDGVWMGAGGSTWDEGR